MTKEEAKREMLFAKRQVMVDSYIDKAYDMAIKALEQPAQQWIPVSERLPNCNGCYLVWRPHFFGGKNGMSSICYFDGKDTWYDSYGVDFSRILQPSDVTAWMTLPEPYKEGEQDGKVHY